MTVGCDDKDQNRRGDSGSLTGIPPTSSCMLIFTRLTHLGDHAYNDLVLAGILEAQKKARVLYDALRPYRYGRRHTDAQFGS